MGETQPWAVSDESLGGVMRKMQAEGLQFLIELATVAPRGLMLRRGPTPQYLDAVSKQPVDSPLLMDMMQQFQILRWLAYRGDICRVGGDQDLLHFIYLTEQGFERAVKAVEG